MIRVGVVGATGYTGVELLRILADHPEAELCLITSRGEAGKPASDLYASLRGKVDLPFTDPADADYSQCDVVFFATPHATAMHHVPTVLDAGARVIDISADYRIQDVAVWEQTYGETHVSPELIPEAVYALPEWNAEAIKGGRLLACPGCYPTAIHLGFLPLLAAGVVDAGSLIADAKTGVSGAGRTAKVGSLFCEAADSFTAYGASGHRHQPEIEAGLAQFSAVKPGLTFVPHLAPMNRGIHATLYSTLADSATDVQALFEERYAEAPFVDVMPAGSHPATRSVRGANVCRIAVHRPANSNVVVVLSVIDNLVKGAAGQAVQGMNLMFGLPETNGLTTIGMLP